MAAGCGHGHCSQLPTTSPGRVTLKAPSRSPYPETWGDAAPTRARVQRAGRRPAGSGYWGAVGKNCTAGGETARERARLGVAMGIVPLAVRTGGMGRVCSRPVRRMAEQARREWWIDW